MRHPYASAQYAACFSPPNTVIEHREWSTYLVERSIPRSTAVDVAGLYPISAIAPSANLPAGLEELRNAGFVSVVLVADPLWGAEADQLASSFSICRPFKTHHVVAPERALTFSSDLRRKIRRAQSSCAIRFCPLAACLDEWVRLFSALSARHQIGGMGAFSRDAFVKMQETPGLLAAVADAQGETVAITLWIRFRDKLYYHLGASSERGYKLRASFGLFGAVIERYREATIDLGGCAGLRDDPEDGLWKFKRGFANASVMAMLCGAVLDEEKYAALTAGLRSDFFPEYRVPHA